MKINTLQELVDAINSSKDYPLNIINDAIEANGWRDLQDEMWDVCTDGVNKVIVAESCIFVVVPFEG